jgi:hypothetical protein
MKNEGLNAKQEKIVTIAAFTALGHLQKLKTALNEGLDAGLAINEIKEILVQMYAYTGFPRSLNGINTFLEVLEEREKKGIKDKPGKEPSPLPANKSSIELGTEIQTHLIGYEPEFGDWLYYALLPLVAYSMLALSAFMALSHTREALFGVGAAALLLLFIGFHNAWDSVAYLVFHSKQNTNNERR